MFTRAVELTSKPGKSKELAKAINERAVPILKKQQGFVDEIVLVSDAEPDRVLALSCWNKRGDAAQYHREQYPKIHETLRHLLAAGPMIRYFDAHSQITHEVGAAKAAGATGRRLEG